MVIDEIFEHPQQSLDRETAARELVLRSEAAVVKRPKVALDEHVGLLRALKEAQDAIKLWQEQEKKVKERLAAVMGDNEVGTLDGREVLLFKGIEGFNSTQFKKDYPDFYNLYSREFPAEKKFDWRWLADVRPDLFRQYQTRPMKSSFEPPSQPPRP